MNERDIFIDVIQLDAPAQRAARLAAACGENAELRQKVEELLAQHEREESFVLDRPPPGIDRTIDQPLEGPGEQIGDYKLLQTIGEGGFGVVYMAEQQQPVRRKVALKIIKPGMDTKEVIARFESERQALAVMDHPNIAKVLGAGSTRGGRPYFVMELVKGLPINLYCDEKNMPREERLRLFTSVCFAVQHAHQKGIIHRDLKPTNVMVTPHDGRPEVKVIDFGIAKATSQPLTERTLFTAYGQMVGTPAYMSPEQAELNALDVDTRSDVYSLGVVLYELLTGSTPFEKERLKSVSFDEMRRIIREEEPETVSSRIARTRTEKPGVDAGVNRRAHAATELDWIVMKCLEKDRGRRYESASALAADIQRYLSDEPVLACPPTIMYRFQKFARKHKPAFATGVAIALCLLLGTTVSAWQAVRATAAESAATANEAQAKEAAAAEAKQRQRAEANEDKANTQRDAAQRQRDEVKALNEKLRRTLYFAHMNMARHAWEAGAIDQMEELLAQHRPKPGETDLRAFEWYYLDRLCHGQLVTLTGHTGKVRGVAYSPDGKRLASCTGDWAYPPGRNKPGEVKVWDPQTGKELLSLLGHSHAVWRVSFSPDGSRIASASQDDTVKVWNAQTGEALLTFQGHTDGVNDVAFSPDGKRLASAADDQSVKVWDAETGQELITLKGHTGGVESVVFSPDGKRLASADWDDITKVWDAETGQELLSMEASGRLDFSPDGKRLATATSIRDAETGQVLLSFKLFNADGMRYSPDGKRLSSASGDKTIRIYDAQTGAELFTLKGHTGGAGGMAFSSDGKRVALASDDGTVKIWDAVTGPEARALSGHTGNLVSVAYSPDGKRLASGSHDETVKLWDVQTGKEVRTLAHNGIVWGIAFSPDGKHLASAGGEHVKVWDSLSGQEILTLMERGNSVAFSPNGKRLAAVTGTPNSGPRGKVKVWDARTGEEQLSLQGHGGDIVSVAFSPDGKRLASGAGAPNTAGEVKIWDAQTGQSLLTLPEPIGGIRSVAYSPDGRHLASGSGLGSVRVWDATTGQELLSLKGHAVSVQSVAFSPDGKRIAAQSLYRKVKVWDAQTGQETLTLNGGHGRGLAFSPDGHRLAGANEHTAMIWDATPLPE